MVRCIQVCLSILLVLCGCSQKDCTPSSSTYTIGIDPSWYPLRIAGQEKNLLAFSVELLVAVAKQQGLELAVQTRNWDNLLWGLRKQEYGAMLSSMPPYAFYLKEYSFSDPYLMTGPAIVTLKSSSISSVEGLKGKEVGVVRGSPASLLLQTTPGIVLKGYGTIPQLLEGLSREEIEAAAAEILVAQQFVRDLYGDTFRLASGPLSDAGLRLISLHNCSTELIDRFNKGVLELKKNGMYEKLLSKWGLSPDSAPVSHLERKADRFLSQYL